MAFFSSADTNQHDWQKLLMKAGFALLVVAAVFLLIVSINQIRSGQYIGQADKYQNTIDVSGDGEVFAIPDTAEFSFTVTEEAEAVADAQQSVTERSNSIISFLKEQGVEESDLQTTGYNISPRYEFEEQVGIPRPPRGERTLVGYEVSQTTQVKVRDTSNVGELLSGIGEREVSSVSDISFTVDDREVVMEEARSKAIADAKAKARRLADQLDVQQGDVVNFNESASQPQFRYDVAQSEGVGGDAQASTPQISPGENRITSNVNITYEIE
jgi:uncharacterized protein YggE